MKVGVYIIINDPLPKLLEVNSIDVRKTDFSTDSKIVNILKTKLMMDKVDSEFIYAVSLTFDLTPKGIILAGIGNNKCSLGNVRGIATGLLLTGAEQFMVFHNHPGGNKIVSASDRMLTKTYEEMANAIGIEFDGHYMVTKNYFEEC